MGVMGEKAPLGTRVKEQLKVARLEFDSALLPVAV